MALKGTAIIDGQHRMRAAAEVLSKNDLFFDLSVVVDLISVSSQKEVEALSDFSSEKEKVDQSSARACINISNTFVVHNKQNNKKARTHKKMSSQVVRSHESLHNLYFCVYVDDEWRKENGFQVWEIQAWNSHGFPIRGKQWIEHHSLPDQQRGSFKFCRKPGKSSRLVDDTATPLWAPHSWSQARFSEHFLTISGDARGRLKIFQYLMLEEEQKQVLQAHQKLRKAKS